MSKRKTHFDIHENTKGLFIIPDELVLYEKDRQEVIVDKNGGVHKLEYNNEECLVKAGERLKYLSPTFEDAGIAFEKFGKAIKEAEEKGLLKY